MKLSKTLLMAALCGVVVGTTLTSCGGSKDGNKLAIARFDQSILGENQKDLSVSIGVAKDAGQLKTDLDNALSKLSKEQRDDMMLKAVERSSYETPKTEEGKEIITKAPYDESKPTLTIGLECNYSPFNWTDSVATSWSYPINGKTNEFAEGYDVQIAKYLAEEMGYNLVIEKMEWDALIPALGNKTINAIIAGMTDTEERRQSIDFTSPYYTSELVLVVKASSKYASAKSLEEFKGAKFVSQKSTVTDDIIDTWVNEFGVKHLSPLNDFNTCAISVQSGSADVMTAELPVAQAIVNGVN